MRVKDASPLSYKLSSSFILFFYCSFADFSICLNTNFFPSFILDIFSVFWLLWPEENAVRQKRMLMFAVLHQFQLRHFFPHYTLFFSRSRNWECGFCMVHSRSHIKNWLKQFWILYIFFLLYIIFGICFNVDDSTENVCWKILVCCCLLLLVATSQHHHHRRCCGWCNIGRRARLHYSKCEPCRSLSASFWDRCKYHMKIRLLAMPL